MARIIVHVAPRGNAFMRDIAAALVEAARALGHEVPEVSSSSPERDGALHLVVAPHEFFRLSGSTPEQLRPALAASVLVTTEQPGTTWFDHSLAMGRGAQAVLDINADAAAAMRASGVPAQHLQLGGVPGMDATGSVAARDIDVLFLGALDERRGCALAAMAAGLDPLRTEVRLFPFDRPVSSASPGLVFGPAKYELLARSKVLINIHRSGHDERRPYFEWARLIEAMANGCVVVTEPSSAAEPLVPGVHFVEASTESMGDVVHSLLDDEDRRRRIADAARTAVFDELGLAASLGSLLDGLVIAPARATTRVPGRVLTADEPARARTAFRPHLDLQRSAKALVRRHDQLLRRLDRIDAELHGRAADEVTVASSTSWDTAAPDVSVVVTLYNYAHVVTETLDSVLASAGVTPEIIVVDDASTDGGFEVVLGHLANHPEVPWTVVRRASNHGLSAARNLAFERARCEQVMVVDADNHVHPHGIAKLVATLDAAPGACGAYGILEDFGDRPGLRSAFEWDVARLCAANYIDAQAMVRRSAWVALGGYRDNDDEVYGWEDWDLWLRIAAQGLRLAFCPQIVGRYRTQPSSMVSLSNIAADDMRAAIRRRYPDLPWPVA